MGEEFLQSLEQTMIGVFIRESPSFFGFPTVLTIHTFGLCFLVGANVIVSMRMLGLIKTIPLKPLRRLFPFMWVGLLLTVLSGGGLAIAAATTRALNPILLIKLVVIAIASPVMWRIQGKIFNNPALDPMLAEGKLPNGARIAAASQLVMWLLVMIAGRLIAYSATIFGDGY